VLVLIFLLSATSIVDATVTEGRARARQQLSAEAGYQAMGTRQAIKVVLRP
jgi:hypothetical protein